MKLKFLIQLMACNAAGRDMVYFTFEDGVLRDTLYNMYQFLSDNQLSIGKAYMTFYTIIQFHSFTLQHNCGSTCVSSQNH